MKWGSAVMKVLFASAVKALEKFSGVRRRVLSAAYILLMLKWAFGLEVLEEDGVWMPNQTGRELLKPPFGERPWLEVVKY